MATENRIISIARARSDCLGEISRTKIYELIKNGHLRRVKIGRRSFITTESIDAYIDQLSRNGANSISRPGRPGCDADGSCEQ